MRTCRWPAVCDVRHVPCAWRSLSTGCPIFSTARFDWRVIQLGRDLLAADEGARLLEAEEVLQLDALVVRVDVEAVAPQEADERLTEVLGGLDGQVGRRGNGGNDRDAGNRGLLHDLETHPTADHEHPIVERH